MAHVILALNGCRFKRKLELWKDPNLTILRSFSLV
jgi:hypothetical protein